MDGSETVELRTDGGHLLGEVAAVDAHRPERCARDPHGELYRCRHIVGIDQQCGGWAESRHLGAEGLLFAVMQQGE